MPRQPLEVMGKNLELERPNVDLATKAHEIDELFVSLARSPKALAEFMDTMPPDIENFLYAVDYGAACEAKFNELLADEEKARGLRSPPSTGNLSLRAVKSAPTGLTPEAMAPVLQNLAEGNPKAAHRMRNGEVGGLTSHLVGRFLELFDHDSNGVIDSNEFLHINRFFFTLANLEDLVEDPATTQEKAALDRTGTEEQEAETDPAEAEANVGIDALLNQRQEALWNELPKNLDGTVSLTSCWDYALSDFELNLLLDQTSNFASEVAVLKIMKDIHALTSNSEGNVTMKEFTSLFDPGKLLAASRAVLANDESSQNNQVAVAVEGSNISTEVVTATLLPLLESIWAKLPKKRVADARQGFIMAADATSACFVLQNDPEVVSLVGGGNRSKGFALLRAIRNSSTGSLLCSDGSRVMTQAHFLRLGSRPVLNSAEVEVVLPALLAKLWARLVLENGSTKIPSEVCWTAVHLDDSIALLLGDSDLVRGRTLVQALLTTSKPTVALDASETVNGNSEIRTKMMTWESLLATLTSPVAMAAARLAVSLPKKLEAIWAELMLSQSRSKKPGAAVWALLENDEELCWLLGSGDSTLGLGVLKLMKDYEEVDWAKDADLKVTWQDFLQLANPRVLARAGQAALAEAPHTSTTATSRDLGQFCPDQHSLMWHTMPKKGGNCSACSSPCVPGEVVMHCHPCQHSLCQQCTALTQHLWESEDGRMRGNWDEVLAYEKKQAKGSNNQSAPSNGSNSNDGVRDAPGPHGCDSVASLEAFVHDPVLDVVLVAVDIQITSNKWPFKHGLSIEEWINLEYGFGDHAHGLTVVFVSLDGVAAAAVRDNQRQYHPHLKVVAVALEGPQAGALKPLLMQADRALNKAYSSAAKAEAAEEAAVALTGEALDTTKKKNYSPKIVRSGAKAALACLTSKLAQDAEGALKAWQTSSVKKFSVDQVASLELSRKLPLSSADMIALGTPTGEVDSRSLLEAACFDPTVDGLIVEVRNGENAGKARFKHSIALRQFVNLQNSPDPRHSTVASDKCVVFVSFGGAYACVARENQRKYHPDLRCIAVAWEDPPTDALLRYLDSQFTARHPHLKPLGAAHPMTLALSRGVVSVGATPRAIAGARGASSEILRVDASASGAFLVKTLDVLVQVTKQNPPTGMNSSLERSDSGNAGGSETGSNGKMSGNKYKRKNRELAAEILALRAESAALLAKLVELQNQDDNNVNEDEEGMPSPRKSPNKHAQRHSAPPSGRALPRSATITASNSGGAQPRGRRECSPSSSSSRNARGDSAAEGLSSWKSGGKSGGKGYSRYGASLDRPPTSTPGRPRSGSRGKGGGRGSGPHSRPNSAAATPPEWASTKPTKRVAKKVAQHQVRVSTLENRVDALETIAGGSSSPPTALSARHQRQQQASHWADSGSPQSRSYSLGRPNENIEQPVMQMTASLSLRIGP